MSRNDDAGPQRAGPAIEADGLGKSYAGVPALTGFDLTVPAGTVHGLLGPNGSGKTTAVRIMTTLLRADTGSARVAGFDVARQADQVRYHLGLVGQHAAVDEILSGLQNLTMFGRLYHLRPAAAKVRAKELLDQFGLADTGGKPVKLYSGGMRRRLDLAASLILSPPVLFLDEPTTGLDPRSRTEVWQAVRDLVAQGTTVLLTTQYLEEADQLADRISMLASPIGDDGRPTGGRVVAEGTPDQLKSIIGGDRIDLVLQHTDELPAAAAITERVTGEPPTVDSDTRTISVAVNDRMTALTDLLRELTAANISAEDIAVRRPSLDEVFLHLTSAHPAAPVNAPQHDKQHEKVKA
jgi:ABC-2 type transport system ATP-binding protein